MKKTLLLLSFYFFIFLAKGQVNVYHEFPDSNARWNFHYQSFCFGLGSSDELYSIEITGDTIFAGQLYKKLFSPYKIMNNTGTCSEALTGYRGAIREDIPAKKVYYMHPDSTNEALLYDFNLQLGDTVHGYLQSIFLQYNDVVTNIDSVLVGTSYRKRWEINIPYGIYLIEGVGSTYGLVDPSPGNILDFGGSSLICFHQDGVVLYPDTLPECELITSMNERPAGSYDINIFPNPFNDETIISSEVQLINPSISILDLTGKKIRSIKNINGKSISLSRGNLANGVYFLKVSDGEQVIKVIRLIVVN